MERQWCKHYHGMQQDTCEVGVAFKSLPGHGTKGFFGVCPCFGPNPGCSLAEYPTAEEMAAHEAKMNARFERIGKARGAIVSFLGGPWKRGTEGRTGCIDCPACDASKSLHFHRSGYNGHIHAKCDTDDCVSWME